MSIIAWAFVLIILVPAVGLILAELATAPEGDEPPSRLDEWDRPGGGGRG